MQKVQIYINSYHTGHLKVGTGTYTIMLEYITETNEPATMGYLKGINGTSTNRTALRACIEAFEHITKPCDIKVYVNSSYVVKNINDGSYVKWLETGLNAKGKPAANLDLWRKLLDLTEKHQTVFIFTEKNTYTDYMYSMMKRREIEYTEDLL